MADSQIPNTPQDDELPEDRKNEAISRLLERLRKIDETHQAAASQRSHTQRHIATSAGEKPSESAHSFAEPSRDSTPPPQPPPESDPLPINTRHQHIENLRRARQQQARAMRRQAWRNLRRQTGQHITRAVDFSNRWVNRLVSFTAGIGATCIVLLFIQFWAASNTTSEILPAQTAETLHTRGIIPTTTPPPTLSVIWGVNVNPSSPIRVIPPHTYPDRMGCRVSTSDIDISPNTPYNAEDEPTLRLWTQVDTEGCEGRLLRVSLSITRSDGQPLQVLNSGWQLDHPTSRQITVGGEILISDSAPIPIVLELPHRHFPLSPGLHSLSGYLNIRDEETDITLYDVPLEPFLLPIAP